MKEYLKGRLDELRQQYRNSGEAEYLYRIREVQRAYERVMVEETYRQQKHEYEATNGSN